MTMTPIDVFGYKCLLFAREYIIYYRPLASAAKISCLHYFRGCFSYSMPPVHKLIPIYFGLFPIIAHQNLPTALCRYGYTGAICRIEHLYTRTLNCQVYGIFLKGLQDT